MNKMAYENLQKEQKRDCTVTESEVFLTAGLFNSFKAFDPFISKGRMHGFFSRSGESKIGGKKFGSHIDEFDFPKSLTV